MKQNITRRTSAAVALTATLALTACGSGGSKSAPSITTDKNGVVSTITPTDDPTNTTKKNDTKNSENNTATSGSNSDEGKATSTTTGGDGKSSNTTTTANGEKDGSVSTSKTTPSDKPAANGEYTAGVGKKVTLDKGYGGYTGVPLTANIGADPVKGEDTTKINSKLPSSTNGTPISIQIPSIGLYQKLGTVSVNKGVLAPRSGRVSWYNGDVKPGDAGIAKILGHVTYNGPDVFYNLNRVPVGAKVIIKYSGGGQKIFTVYDKKSVNKHQLQTDDKIWGTSKTPIVALVTCDGSSRMVGTHHVNNYVLWAK